MSEEKPEIEDKEEQNDPKLLGDIIGDALDAIGGQQVAKAIEKITSKPCNCGARRRRLNAIDSTVRQKVRTMIGRVNDE